MHKLRELWCRFLCRWGWHDWTRWTNCKHRWDVWEFRTCKRCPIKECRKTIFGLLTDDAQLEKELGIERRMVQSMSNSVLDELTSTIVEE